MRRRSDRPWVLVVDGGDGQSRSPLATVRALAAGGYRAAVTVSGRRSLASVSRYCERAVRVPSWPSEDFAGAVADAARSLSALTTFPTSDAALVALGADVEHLVDKSRLASTAEAAGIQVAPGELFPTTPSLRAASDRIVFPVVVKPVRSRYPARFARDAADFDGLPDDGAVLVQPFVAEELRAVGGVMWRGRIVAAVHQRYIRIWPLDCGGASAAETIEADVGTERRLERMLGGFEGVFMAQFAGPFLLDLNPRVYGSLPLAVASGVNLPAIYCDLLQGYAVAPSRGRPGVFYRSLEGDLRHLFNALRDRTMSVSAAARALRPRPGSAHGPESVLDPRPMMARLGHAARRLGESGPLGPN